MINNYTLKLLNHKFHEEVQEDAYGYIREILEDAKYSPTELEQYSFNIIKWLQRIYNSFNALTYTRVYMEHFRSNKWFKEAGIVKANYLNYHYIKYAITVVTIFDICLRLTNYVFKFGYLEKHCSLIKIQKNVLVKSSNVGDNLTELNRIVQPWREPRNLFVHSGDILYNERLTALEAYEQLSYLHRYPSKISANRIKIAYKFEIIRIFKEFDEVEVQLFIKVDELLNNLLPIYIGWREKLE